MANTLNDKELLPDRASLALCHVEKGAHGWVVEAVGPETAACPNCGVLSTARHSSYTRHLRDLPVQGRPVHLKLRVGRWRCRNSDCERQIFCQRLTRVSHKHARETKRFGEVVQQIAYALGGRPGERLSSRLGLPVSDDTLLRRIKQWAKSRPPTKPIRVLGVDDWAWRKGYGRYGTILVDLKRRKVADLLPECSAAAVEQWLRQHSKIKDHQPGCVTNVSENLQSCTEDGRRPPGVGFQESASNHSELLRPKGVVVNVRGKGVRRGRQVSVEKMSESEPSDDASLMIQGTVRTGAARLLQDESGRNLFTGPAAVGV